MIAQVLRQLVFVHAYILLAYLPDWASVVQQLGNFYLPWATVNVDQWNCYIQLF